jgi:sulfide:quinone oxidoreductase
VVVLRPGGETLTCDRVVALPVVRGVPVEGLPHDPEGFLPIDSHARVSRVSDVYAAGDGANFPLKQGGIACQQADAGAEDIARAAGIPVEARPFRPVLRGRLMTGGKPHFMRRDIGDPTGAGESTDHMLWWPPTKIAGKYLAPYVALQQKREGKAAVQGGQESLLASAVNEAGELKLHGYEFAAR